MPTRYRFDADDILYNKIRSYPKTELHFYQGNVYLDNQAHSGSNANHPNGHLNLYGMNASEVSSSDGLTYQQYIEKTPNGIKFKTISTSSYNNNYEYGDKMYASLPLTATIEGIHYSTQSYANGKIAKLSGLKSAPFPINAFFQSDFFVPQDINVYLDTTNNLKALDDLNISHPDKFEAAGLNLNNIEYVRKNLFSLKNIINSYTTLSPHFQYSASISPYNRDLETSELTILNIPSAFYGESINKGSVRLEYYHTGVLAGVAEDTLQNGELIHTGPGSAGYSFDSTVSGSVVGLVLYDDGIIILTSSVSLHPDVREVFRPGLLKDTVGDETPKWINFASTIWTGSATPSSSWGLEFEGVNHIPTLTMYAHAKRGHLNHSNNPSFVNFNDVFNRDLINYTTSSYGMIENEERRLYNFVSSSYKQARVKNSATKNTTDIFPEFSASFKKQVYISKIGIYDDDNNLIAVAKLAQPFRKEESDSISFKLKLDL